MSKLFTHRRVLLLISVFAILMLTLLAAGLSNLAFAPAHSGNFGGEEVRPLDENLVSVGRAFEESPWWQQGLLVGGFFLVLLLALIFMPTRTRKELLKRLLWLIIFAALMLIFVKPSDSEPQIIMPEENIGMSAPPLAEESASGIPAPPAETFNPDEVSPFWGYLISFGLILLAGIALWWLWRVWDQARQITDTPQEELQRIVRASLDDLAEGAAWEDVIIRSYVEMGVVVNERRGIARDVEMTPHEFAQRLVSAGLPANPVHELTRLFERVRYSPHIADEQEMARAVACLEEIAKTFGEKL